jgi:hypothetical protein
LKDYFFPRTGGTDENGRPSRVSLPSYMKDVFALREHPLKTLTTSCTRCFRRLRTCWPTAISTVWKSATPTIRL